MVIKTFLCLRVPEGRMLPALALMAVLATTMSAMAQRQSWVFAYECSVKDVKVLTLIEEHGIAQDLPADRLAKAGLAMLDARTACYDGRVNDALALYDSVLALGPVASLRPQ